MKKTINIKIDGMMCIHCQGHVEEAFKEIKEIKKAKVDFKTGLAQVVVDTNNLDGVKNIIENAIKELGYKVIEFEEK